MLRRPVAADSDGQRLALKRLADRGYAAKGDGDSFYALTDEGRELAGRVADAS